MKVRVLGCSGAISKDCRTTSLQIHALADTIAALKTHIFDDIIWPDFTRLPAFWERLNQLDVVMLVIETAFSNREKGLAQSSLHLSPQVLADELDCIAPDSSYPIYITHTKSLETELIMTEIQRLDQTLVDGPHVSHDIRWLRAGQEFEL